MSPKSIMCAGVAGLLLGVPPISHALEECGTVLTPQDVAVIRYLQSVGAYDFPTDSGRLVPNIPVTLHVARRTDGTGGISAATADARLLQANGFWQSIGIQFFRQGPVVFINDDGLFDIGDEIELGILWNTSAVGDTVNVYFVNTLSSVFAGGDICGIASFPISPFQGVTVSNSAASGCVPSGNLTVLAHELGHYFDLYHTHDTTFGEECPDGSNCSTAGDSVCDTPADPNLNTNGLIDANTCEYIGTLTRCDDPFDPDTSNVMAYSVPRTCRDHFTSGQRSRVLSALNGPRANLVDAGNPNMAWVDFDAGSLFPDGGFGNPWITLQDALNHVAAGGRIVFKGGSTAEIATISQAVTLDSFGGSAVIGS